MPDGYNGNLFDVLQDHIGETVTIFTTSGGQSGSGFTGVLIDVNPVFVRLLIQIGIAPGCALGNSCCCHKRGNRHVYEGNNGGYYNNVGSVADIPVDRIASFVHNAV